MKLRSLVFAGAAAAALAAAPAANAADGTTLVQGLIGTELSVVPVALPGTISLTRTGANESSSTISVVSLGAWTMKACESGGDGAMSRTLPTAYTLSSPMQIKFRAGSFTDLGSDCDAAGAPTTTGTGIEAAVPVTYKQSLTDADSDDISVGNTFGLTVTYRLLNG